MSFMINRPLADMESGGVYFNEDDRIQPVNQDKVPEEVEVSEEDICHYSGLRSMSFYEKSAQSIV